MTDDSNERQLLAELEKLAEKPLGEGEGSGKWDAEPGDHLAGEVVKAEPEYEGKWGTVPRLRIRVRAGTESGGTPIERGEVCSLICSPFRLKEFFEHQQPKAGDVVLIHFAGEVPSKTGGKPWGDYRPKLHRRAEPTELEAEDESRGGEQTPFLPEDGS